VSELPVVAFPILDLPSVLFEELDDLTYFVSFHFLIVWHYKDIHFYIIYKIYLIEFLLLFTFIDVADVACQDFGLTIFPCLMDAVEMRLQGDSHVVAEFPVPDMNLYAIEANGHGRRAPDDFHDDSFIPGYHLISSE
jgi:hypothetical protein